MCDVRCDGETGDVMCDGETRENSLVMAHCVTEGARGESLPK